MPLQFEDKLTILADAAKYDASCASSGSNTKRAGAAIGSTEGMGICHSFTPDGRCVSLLKILLTNYCIYDCQFCVNRVSSDTQRARFSVEEVVKLTLDFYRRNYIEGLFLSSGIIQDSDYTMEQLVRVAKTLRTEHRYGGYIHLKTIPGCSESLIDEAGLYADRLSVNIELPTQRDLKALAPEKDRPTIESAMASVKDRVEESQADRSKGFRAPKYAPAGQSTQMVVGATDTSDREILKTTSDLYGHHRLRRVYYSAFSPHPHADARLPTQKPELIREHRLYQADWLLRFYGFAVDEITDDDQPNLSLEIDPKTAWALRNRDRFPVDVNAADREMLLRVPGLGTKSVKKILSSRRFRKLRLADLKRLRVPMKKASPFLITADSNPHVHGLDALNLEAKLKPRDTQLELFAAGNSALFGDV